MRVFRKDKKGMNNDKQNQVEPPLYQINSVSSFDTLGEKNEFFLKVFSTCKKKLSHKEAKAT